MLTNNEINDIIKVIDSIENRATSQNGGLLNFLVSLMKVDISLEMYCFGTKCFCTFTITSSSVSNIRRYSRKVFGIETTTLVLSNKDLNDVKKIIKYLKILFYS